MMKKLLFFSIFLLAATFLSAQQDLTLFYHFKPVLSGDTILKYGDAYEAEIVLEQLQVKNNTGKAMSIMVKRERLQMQAGASSQFCWGLCYPPDTEVSPTSRLIMPESTSTPSEFSGHYIPNGVLGASYVRYTFYKETDENVNASIVIKFLGTPTGIAEEAMAGGSVSDIYPNPANNVVSLDYQLTPEVDQASVKIFNLMGVEVKSAQLSNAENQVKFDISDLTNGIYFYTVVINGDAYRTKKLVVQK